MSDTQTDDDRSTAPRSTVDGPPHPLVPNPLNESALTEAMGIVILEASAELLVATMPVAGNTQPLGLLHGGASCVLAESLGSVGAAMHAARLGLIAVGIELNATHHRSATSGLVTGTARPLQLGRSLASYEIVIVDDADRRICTARLTCMLRPLPTPTQQQPPSTQQQPTPE